MTTDDTAREALRLRSEATPGEMRAFPRELNDGNWFAVARCSGQDVMAPIGAEPFLGGNVHVAGDANLFAFAANHIATLAQAVLDGPQAERERCIALVLQIIPMKDGETRFRVEDCIDAIRRGDSPTAFAHRLMSPQPPAPADEPLTKGDKS